MSNTLEERDWTLLLHRIKQGRCMPFLGAGAAYKALPLGGDIAREWAAQYEYPLTDTWNLPKVAQFLAVHYDPMFPKETLAESFKQYPSPDFSNPDEPHAILADLGLPLYMTTNYDNFMTEALKARRNNPVTKVVQEIARWNKDTKRIPSCFDSGFNPSTTEPVVFHLHGQLDTPKSMVLTEDDYLDFLVRMSSETSVTTTISGSSENTEPRLLPPRIEEAFADSTLLFLGYGLADWDFRVLFRGLVEYLERSSSRSHVSVQLLPVEKEMSNEQKENVQRYFDEYYGRLQIRVFWGTCREFVSELKKRWDAFNEQP